MLLEYFLVILVVYLLAALNQIIRDNGGKGFPVVGRVLEFLVGDNRQPLQRWRVTAVDSRQARVEEKSERPSHKCAASASPH